MPRYKILSASIVALFCCAVSFIAFADAPGSGSASAAYDAGTGSAHEEVSANPGPIAAAPAQPAVMSDAPALPSADAFVEAIRTGDWRLVAAFALVAIMIGLRRVRDKVPWLKGDRAGAVLVMLLSFGGALSTSLATDAPIDTKMVLAALTIAWTAVGGYTWLKRLVWPDDKPPAPEAGPDGIPRARVVS